MSGKRYKNKTVGTIDEKFCTKTGISKYSNFKIEQSLGLIYHVQKHLNDFINVDSFNKTLMEIPTIISKPYFMYYDKVKNSIRYYKRVEEFVCVVVNINETSAFVSTVYPVKKTAVDKLKMKNKDL